MTVRLLTGSRIRTLTDAVLEDVRAGNAAWPDRRGLILIPEDRKLNIERAYLEQSDSGNLMMAEVLSFNRLTMRLLTELGLFNEMTLNRRMQAMIMRRLLFEKKDELRYYRHLHADPAFPDRLNGVIREFHQYRITAAELRSLEPPDKGAADLFHDLALLDENYVEFLADRGLHDHESRLSQLLHELEKMLTEVPAVLSPAARQLRKKLGQTDVWVDGYGEHLQLSGLQYRLLTLLEKLCASLTVSLVIRPEDLERRDFRSLFSRRAGLALYHSLLDLFPNAEIIAVERLAAGPGMVAERKASLSSAASAGRPYAPLTTAARLILWEHPDIISELQAAAGEIKRLQEAGLCRYRDVAVVCPVEEVGAERVRSIFAEVGVPAFFKLDSQAVFTEIPDLILSALDCVRYGWRRKNVMAWLRHIVVCERPEEADLWETYCLQYGLFGYRLGSDRAFDHLAEGLSGRIQADRKKQVLPAVEFLNNFRERYLRPLFDLASRLRQSEDSHTYTRYLMDFMESFGLEQKVEERSAALLAEGADQEAMALVKSWNESIQLLADLVRVTEPIRLTLGEYRHILAAGLEQLGADIIPSTLEQVTIGNAHMALGSRADLLFILAADRDHLPPSTLPESALKQVDRQFLADRLNIDLPDLSESKAVWDLFSLEQLPLLPDRRLYLSYSRPAVAAPLFRRAMGQAKVRSFPEEISRTDDPRLYHPATTRLFLLDLLSRQRLGSADSGQLEIGSNSTLKDDVETLIRRTLKGNPEVFHSAFKPFSGPDPGQARHLYLPEAVSDLTRSDQLTMSISRLETYAGCPYRYFFQHILQAEERRIAEPNVRELGSLRHRVMEAAASRYLEDETFRQALADPEAWPSILADTQSYVDRLIETDEVYYSFRRPEVRQGILAWTAQNAANAVIGYFSSLEAEVKQIYTEWQFGFVESGRSLDESVRSEVADHQPPVLMMKLGGRVVPVSFRGIIDRVDLFEDRQTGVYSYHLLDYKSRDRQVSLGRICNGLDFQLPVYCAAWQLNHPDQQPSGIGYLGMDRDGEVRDKAGPDSLPEVVVRNYSPALFTGGVISFEDLETTGMKAAETRLSDLLAGDFSARPRTEAVDIKINKKGELVEKNAGKLGPLPCTYCGAAGLCRIDLPDRHVKGLTETWPRRLDSAGQADKKEGGEK